MKNVVKLVPIFILVSIFILEVLTAQRNEKRCNPKISNCAKKSVSTRPASNSHRSTSGRSQSDTTSVNTSSKSSTGSGVRNPASSGRTTRYPNATPGSGVRNPASSGRTTNNNGGNAIVGTVKYAGKPPKKKPLRMDADPVCGSSHSSKVYSESFKVNAKGELAECIVYLKGVSYFGGIPSTAVELDQKGCIYTPHVFGIQTGQELIIKNSDATLHNIHSMPKKNKEFNFAMPKVVKEKKAKFKSSEDPFYIKCDVHPWMKTWVLVSDHPYYAVTDSNGDYEIKGVPAGTYEIVCWQEKFKRYVIVDKVTVGSGSVTKKDFTFTRPKKKK